MTIVEEIVANKIVAVVRLKDYSRALEVTQALTAGNIKILEFTLTGQGAIEAIRTTRLAMGDQARVGVGTVLNPRDAETAINAGAQFVVTPIFRRDVIAICQKLNTPILCGAFSPTEIMDAYEAGAEMIKVFPADVGGPKYIKGVLAPMPFLKLVPTGGVSQENARDYLAAGAVAVGIGGNLVSDKLVQAGAFEQITTTARGCFKAVHNLE